MACHRFVHACHVIRPWENRPTSLQIAGIGVLTRVPEQPRMAWAYIGVRREPLVFTIPYRFEPKRGFKTRGLREQF